MRMPPSSQHQSLSPHNAAAVLFSYLYRRSSLWKSTHERLLTPSLTYFLTAQISRRLRPRQRPYSTLVVFDSASTALDFQSLARRNALRILPGPSVDLVSTLSSPFFLRCSTMISHQIFVDLPVLYPWLPNVLFRFSSSSCF